MGAEGETLFVNPAFYELLSSVPLQKHLLLKQSQLFTLFPPTTNPRSIGDVILSHAQVGLSWSSEVEITHDRKRRIHEVHSSPVFDEYGQLSRIVVIRRDVTEERIAQASAAHNDRLAAIGTLAAGMAHEINNPLTYIKMSLDLIQEGLKETTEQRDGRLLDQKVYEELNDATHDASEGVDRVSHIVQSLLSIARSGGSRGSNEAMSMVSLIEVVQACSSLVKPEFSRSLQLEIEVDHTLSVMGRRSELIQVLLNLLINAAQAMPKNRLSGHWIKVTSSMMESGEIQLIVSDNAQGIPTDDLDHIFEPFFSSKPVGEGSGLGLAVSHGIIEAHQATISVSSVEGEGTTFTLTFSGGQSLTNSEDISKNLLESSQENLLLEEPGLARDAEVEESQALMSSISIAKRRILVVDDDVLVAKSLAKMLRQDIVVTSSSGAQALQILATSRFDLILSDVMMPNMDGPTFYQELTIRFPRYQERFIFITGAAKNSEIAQAIRETKRLILSKPITKQQLLNAVNKVLATVV